MSNARAVQLGQPRAMSPRRAGRLLFAAGVVLLCAWVLLPIYLLLVNALSSPREVTHFPKAFVPSFDTESVAFFLNYSGVASALWNSMLTATLTMVGAAASPAALVAVQVSAMVPTGPEVKAMVSVAAPLVMVPPVRVQA